MERSFNLVTELTIALICSLILGAGWGFLDAFIIFTSGLSGSGQKPDLILEYTIFLPLLPITKLHYPLEAVWISGPIFVFLIYIIFRLLFSFIRSHRS